LKEDACSTVVMAVEKYGDFVARSAEDLEDFYGSCARRASNAMGRDIQSSTKSESVR
jgi:hypothetical protein